MLAFLWNAPSANAQLELVYTDSLYQVTGIAVDTAGRIFITHPYWSDVHKYGVVEVSSIRRTYPYPDKEWNGWKPGIDGKEMFVCPQAVHVDKQNNLWVVDPASPFLQQTVDSAVKVVSFNLRTNKLNRIYYISPEVAGKDSYINDIQVDVKREFAYLTDSKQGAIIVLDLVTGTAYKGISNHFSTRSDTAFNFNPDGKTWATNGTPNKVHADGIALSPDGKMLYYKPLTDDKLYRIKTKALRNYFLKTDKKSKKIEDLGHVCTSDGMVFSPDGHLYMGDIVNKQIIKYHPGKKKKEVILQSDQLIWPDSYAIHNGYLYITISQIHRMPAFNDGKDMRSGHFVVYRMKLP